jgi:hypothetical protein
MTKGLPKIGKVQANPTHEVSRKIATEINADEEHQDFSEG